MVPIRALARSSRTTTTMTTMATKTKQLHAAEASSHSYEDMRAGFCSEVSLAAHYEMQQRDCASYAATITLFSRRMVPLTNGNKSRVLAAALARRDWELAELVMDRAVDPTTSVGIVYKAIKLLDAQREATALEKKLQRDERQMERMSLACTIRPSKVRKQRRKANLIRSNINDLRAEPTPETATLTSSVARWITKLLTKLPADAYSSAGREHIWKHICDLCHVKPSQVPAEGFVEALFSKGAAGVQPSDALLTEHTLADAVRSGVKYDKIRALLPEVVRRGVSEDVMIALAEHEDLDTLLWWYETELRSEHIEKAIHQRLSAGQVPTLSYGKLVERIVTLGTVPDTGPKTVDEALAAMGLAADDLPYDVLAEISEQIAQSLADSGPQMAVPGFLPDLVQAAGVRQKDIALPLRTPVLVAGDMSASMQVCVMSASIIASIITGLAEAELVFFNHQLVTAPIQPKDCASAVELSHLVQAVGQTANASALVEAYELRKRYNTVVMVTDEEENTKAVLSNGQHVLIAELFKLYET